ncbi:ATP-binding protein, partial [filamentous cyanobacterium CCP1]
MVIQLKRTDVGYTIISRFEESFRAFLSESLEILFDNYHQAIPSGIVGKAEERSQKEDWDGVDDFLEEIDFPDLKEIVLYKNQYLTYFPRPSLTLQEFSECMDDLYELRCKIAHIRAFTSLDLDKLSDVSRKIAKQLDRFGSDFINFIDVLSVSPEEVVIPTPVEFLSNQEEISNVRNNVPTGDYEYEGGFVQDR